MGNASAQGAAFMTVTHVKNSDSYFAWMRGVAGMKKSPTARLLGLRLALHRNAETGQCNPSYQTLADEVGVDRCTAIRAINSLVDAGWIAPPDSKGGRSNNFVLTIPDSSASATVKKRNSGTSATVSNSETSLDENETVAPAPLNSSTSATEQSHQRYPNDKEGPTNDRAAPERAAHTVRVEREKLVTDTEELPTTEIERGSDEPLNQEPEPETDEDAFEQLWKASPISHRGARNDALVAYRKARSIGMTPDEIDSAICFFQGSPTLAVMLDEHVTLFLDEHQHEPALSHVTEAASQPVTAPGR
jgi:hypothetical protein